MIVLTTRKACRVALEAVVRKIENWRKVDLVGGVPRPIFHASPAILGVFPPILFDLPRLLPPLKGFRPAASGDRERVL